MSLYATYNSKLRDCEFVLMNISGDIFELSVFHSKIMKRKQQSMEVSHKYRNKLPQKRQISLLVLAIKTQISKHPYDFKCGIIIPIWQRRRVNGTGLIFVPQTPHEPLHYCWRWTESGSATLNRPVQCRCNNVNVHSMNFIYNMKLLFLVLLLEGVFSMSFLFLVVQLLET